MSRRSKHSERRQHPPAGHERRGGGHGAPSPSAPEPDFRAVFESVPASCLLLDRGLTIVAATDSYLRVTKTTREGILGRGMFEVFPDDPDDPHATGTRNLRTSVERVLVTRAPDTMAVQRYPIRVPASEGGGFTERYYSPVNVPVLGVDGEIAYIIHRVEDVTELVRLKQQQDEQSRLTEEQRTRAGARIELARLRRQVARETERLRESEERFRTMADAAPVIIWVTDFAGNCAYVNATWLRATGQTLEQAQGWGWLDAIHPEDRSRVLERFTTAAAAREPYAAEYRLRRADRVYRWILANGVPRPDDGFVGYIGSCVDITDRKQAEEMQAEADRRKDEFLAMLAHELRNPLAPMRMALHIIRAQPSGAPSERHLQILERQTDNLARLVDDLLDVSRLTRGKIALRKERLDVSSAVSHAVDATRGLLEARRHQVSVTLPEAPVPVFADAVRLEQILVNLLTNAAKYTEPGGRIDVYVERIGARVEIGVRDTGAGIAPHMLDRVWHIFQQAERTLDRSQGGLGIGLSIVRLLVEMHGGTVEARSRGLGHGSTFIVRLPVVPDEPARAPDDPARPAVAAPPSASNDTDTREPVRRLCVLVVDDNVDAASTLGELVRSQGHEVRVVHDGLAALAAAEERLPDLVFLDIGLPGLDGYEVARRLRAAAPRPPKLVALTGYGQEADRRRAEQAGFAYHLVKPARPDVVLGLLKAAT
ncbi:MAG: PAS domain S-box protein [Minicystis sp.]